MTQDLGEPDNTSAARLVEALRREIQELEDAVGDEDVALPEGIRTLLRQAAVPARIAAAVDEVLAEVEPIDAGLAERLEAGLESVLAERGTGIVFLEQATAHERQRRQLDIGDISGAVGAPAEVLADIENGRAAFDDQLTEAQVAAWIRVLELDVDDAVEALRQSLVAPVSAYSGDPQEHKRKANAFAEEVRRLLRREQDPQA